MYYEYDYDYEEYVCTQSCLDEDDVAKLAMDSRYKCPYYREGDNIPSCVNKSDIGPLSALQRV